MKLDRLATSGALGALLAGRYRLREQLGAGGMGVVFSARDEVLARDVALKQLRLTPEHARKRKLIEALFEREYHTLARLQHPRIVEAYEYGIDPQGPYYTMELLAGRDLKELAPLPYKQACQHLRDVASALALLHAHGLVHRDVSPRNVRLGPDGRAKLIDFGALAPFGAQTSVVGTPIGIAPELLRRMPLDQRADLYALGAIAYLALTGFAPFPARDIESLHSAWQKPLRPPSQRALGIPPALDALVLSLLSLDPLARPSSAAAVIDQLTAIAELAPEEHEHAADGYLLSGALVGRERERQWLHKRLARVIEGHGTQVVVSGAAGIGKTRLLHELSLEAQLKGVVVLKADAQATPEAFGVATRLGVELLLACPEQARRAAEPHAGLLAQLSETLRERLQNPALVPLATDPNERRARFQTALHDWFVQVSKQCPIFIAVDNVSAADPSSAAFLVALGRACDANRMLLFVTQLSGAGRVASESLRALRHQATQLKLGALDEAECERLVQSLFGDVPNVGRVAKLLHERSGGNPQHCLELVHVLVRKRIAKYVGGTWVLPLDVDRSELPDRLEQLVAERLAALSRVARDLAETLSVDGAPVSIERCLALANGASPGEVYQALDELAAEQILVVQNDSYRFAQPAQREAVLEQMDESRRRARHLQIAHEMLADNPKHGRRVAAALHLLRGGEEGRGADIIAQAGGAYVRETEVYDSTAQVVDALQEALAIYDKQGRSKAESMMVLYPLIALGYFIDWRVIRDHSKRGLSIGLEITGLGRAHALSRVIGDKAALVLALGAASLKFRKLRRRGLDFDIKAAIRALCAMVPGTMGTHATFFDLPAMRRYQRMLEPIAMLGKPDQVPKLLYRFVEIQPLIIEGRAREAAEALIDLAPRFMTPRMIKELGEGQCRAMYGGVIYCAAIEYCFYFGTRALELAKEMDELSIHTWTASAEQVRLLYHAVRGESEAMARCRARVELFAVQGESTWQMEMFLPALLLDANLLAGDTVAARRNAEQLARRAEQVASLVPYARLAQAGYLSLRGDLPTAIAAFEEALPLFPPYSYPSWLLMRAHFADALNRAGEHARAKQLLLEAIACTKLEDEVAIWNHLEARRQLALAEAGLGEHGRAVEQLDALLAQHGQEDNPLLVGLLHKARAEVALLMNDKPALQAHFARMEECFRATANPVLIAQAERLAVCAKLRQSTARDTASDPAPDDRSVLRSFSELTLGTDRYRHALRLVLQRSRAHAGFLYVLRGQSMQLVAANDPGEPPLGLETELVDAARRLQGEEQDDCDETRLLEREGKDASAYQVLLLTTHRERRPVCIGGLILRHSERALLDAAFLDSLAQALDDRDERSAASEQTREGVVYV